MIDRKLMDEYSHIPIAHGGLEKTLKYLFDHIDALERRIESLEKLALEEMHNEEI